MKTLIKHTIHKKHTQHKKDIHHKKYNKKYNNTKKQRSGLYNRYDNTYILVKCYFSDEDMIKYSYLETLFKKYNLSSNRFIKDIIDNDYKILKQKHITKSSDITNQHITNINKYKNKVKPSVIFFNINNINLNIRYYGIPTLLANVLSRDKIHIIENKSNLYDNFIKYNKQLANKYLPYTFNINELDKYIFSSKDDKDDKVFYILKPVDSMGGIDIFYVSSMKDVHTALEYYKTHTNYRKRIYGNHVIAQDYITKPLLYSKTIDNVADNVADTMVDTMGYKCHFRVPFVVSYINKKIDSFILEDGIRILTAKEPYNLNLPFQKEVHDTHIKSSGGDFFLRKDYKNLNITITQCNDIIKEFTKISKIMENILKQDTSVKWLYSEHKNGFNIFGIDFMIEDNRQFNGGLDIKLIEINNSPSFMFHDKSNNHKQSEIFFQALDKYIFSKVF